MPKIHVAVDSFNNVIPNLYHCVITFFFDRFSTQCTEIFLSMNRCREPVKTFFKDHSYPSPVKPSPIHFIHQTNHHPIWCAFYMCNSIQLVWFCVRVYDKIYSTKDTEFLFFVLILINYKNNKNLVLNFNLIFVFLISFSPKKTLKIHQKNQHQLPPSINYNCRRLCTINLYK